MRRLGGVTLCAVLGLAAGCTPNEPIPEVKIPEICEQQVYADPAVREEIVKGAGSDYYRNTHQATLAYAKLDAVGRCMRMKGLAAAPIGGVERPRRTE